MFAYFKFRLQRDWRRVRREFRQWRGLTANYVNRHLFGKWRQLGIIRRLVVVWWGLAFFMVFALFNQMQSLSKYYVFEKPLPGGRYTEAIIGTVKNINPVLPESSTADDVSRLVFDGLVRFNPKGQIEADLATKWEVSSDGRAYTFHLRKDVKWHDGVPFTAQDVAFTFAAIQNPDSRSPLAASWQGVQVEIADDYTVVFRLPNPYTPFLTACNIGIIPRHSLESIDPSRLRVAEFNQHPIGTGPFKLRTFETAEGVVTLEANDDYFAGRPKLDEFVIRAYSSATESLDAVAKFQADSVAGLSADDLTMVSKLGNLRPRELSLPDETAAFFLTTQPNLKDAKVRTAIVKATDRSEMVNELFDGLATARRSPILPGQLGYNPKYQQPSTDIEGAKKLLTDAGWIAGTDGVRVKGGLRLNLRLVTSQGGRYPQAAALLKRQWAKIGVDVTIVIADSNTLQQTYIRPRNYDVLLYGISIGADPDVYAYWHSSQAKDPGLNLSAYANSVVDTALERARTNTDPDIRSGKYQVFQAAWQADEPAVILYSPSYLYATSVHLQGVLAKRLTVPSDRYYGVERWTIRHEAAARY